MWKIIVLVLLTAWLPSGCVAASEQKAAMAAGTAKPAFCWPLAEFRYSLNRPTGGWLAPRGRASQHIGVDMFTAIGQPVRAIADGVVYDISESGWGSGNVAIMIKHRLTDGRWFIALYGHVRNIFGLQKGSRVQGCKAIATVGPYRCGSHVHLGIIAPGRFPHAPYGTCKKYNHNNFINPVHFLQTGQPEEPGKDEEPESPLEGEQSASAALSPQCAGQNLAEGSEKDDLLEDILKSTDEQAAPADKTEQHLDRKKGRHHHNKTAKLSKRERSKKERGQKKAVVRSAKGKAKKLQAKQGRTKHAVSAPARKQQAAKHQSGKAKGQQTKQKARKPVAKKRAARKR